jgi:transposase
MRNITDPRLLVLKSHLTPEGWAARLAEADRQTGLVESILARQAAGSTRVAAVRELCPGEAVGTWQQRIEKYQQGGWETLVNRRYIKAPERLTVAVQGFIRGALAANPRLRSHEIAAAVREKLGGKIHPSTVRHFLQSEGLAQPEGRPRGSTRVEEVALAGAELILGVDIEVGAVAHLTQSLQGAMEGLPAPEGPLRDTHSNRDDHGRFLSAYNVGQAKGEAAVAPKLSSPASDGSTWLRVPRPTCRPGGVLHQPLLPLDLRGPSSDCDGRRAPSPLHELALGQRGRGGAILPKQADYVHSRR